jgi:enoyl-[acyl-carrier protein] reductase II
VIAAGGIADGRGVVAAFALGAEAVQMGTRFVCAAECRAHARYKEMLIRASDRSTVVTGRSTGHPVRCLKNKFSAEFERMEAKGSSVQELEVFGSGRLRAAVMDGDMEWGSLMAGQIAGMVRDVRPAAEILRELFDEAGRTADRLAGTFGSRD